MGGVLRKSGKSIGSFRWKSVKEEKRLVLFFCSVDKKNCLEWFDEGVEVDDFSVWVDMDMFFIKELKGVNYVVVSLVCLVGF